MQIYVLLSNSWSWQWTPKYLAISRNTYKPKYLDISRNTYEIPPIIRDNSCKKNQKWPEILKSERMQSSSPTFFFHSKNLDIVFQNPIIWRSTNSKLINFKYTFGTISKLPLKLALNQIILKILKWYDSKLR